MGILNAIVAGAAAGGGAVPIESRDVDRALEEGYSTGRGLGLRLPGARRLMDHLVVDSSPGRGTSVEMWKWSPRR